MNGTNHTYAEVYYCELSGFDRSDDFISISKDKLYEEMPWRSLYLLRTMGEKSMYYVSLKSGFQLLIADKAK